MIAYSPRSLRTTKTESCYKEIYQHWNSWKLGIWVNPTKCVMLRILNKKKTARQTHYQLHGRTLEAVDTSKFLGVTLTENLSWDKHIQRSVSKANRTVGFLRRNLRDCTPPVKYCTYKTMVCPIVEYASTVWDPHQQASIEVLEQVQRQAARHVFNDYSTRTQGCVRNMLADHNWEPLGVWRRHDRLSMLSRMLHILVDVPANTYLSPSDSRTRGTVKCFPGENQRLYLFQFQFPKTARDWNKLPSRVISVCSLPGRIQITRCVTLSITGKRDITLYFYLLL